MSSKRRRATRPGPRAAGASTDQEWIGGRRPAPVLVGKPGNTYRPEIALWMEHPSALVVGQELVEPGDAPGLVGRALRKALSHPLIGPSRRPARIRVDDAALVDEVREVVGAAIPIEIAPTPEIDALIAAFAASVSKEGDGEPRSYLDGAPEEAVAELFHSAKLLFQAAPWKANGPTWPVRMDIPALGVSGACLCIIGALGESVGVLIFPSFAGYEAFGDAADALDPESDGPIDFGSSVLGLEFVRGADLPPAMRREVATHGWPVAGADAHPLVTHRERDGVSRPVGERDLRIAAACARALAPFFHLHRELFVAEEIDEPACETWTQDEIGVTLTLPYDAFEDFDVPDTAGADRAADLRVTPPAPPRAGRNDPCPCGSGRKYKKCHLAADEAARASSADRAAAHDLDNRLTEALVQFAVRRFGEEMDAVTRDFEDMAAASQLSLHWSLFHFRVRGKTVAEWYREEHGARIREPERAWLDAQQASWLSVWEVEAVEPGVSLSLRDLLTGETRRVREVKGSHAAALLDTMLARVVDHAGESLLCGAHPRVLSPRDAAEVVARVRRRLRRKREVPAERLRSDEVGRYLITCWEGAIAKAEARVRAMRLLNRDGDPFLLTVDRFAIGKGEQREVAARLAQMEDVEPPEPGEDPPAFVFFAPADTAGPLGRTIVGRAVVTARQLRVETTSRERADALRARIETACGEHVRHHSRDHTDPLSEKGALADNRAARTRSGGDAVDPLPEPPPEVQDAVLAWKRRYYASWIDESIPALDGATPREAARTRRGRERLDLLLRDMENREQRGAQGKPFDFGEVRRELGLE
jgi:hypothetical protein